MATHLSSPLGLKGTTYFKKLEFAFALKIGIRTFFTLIIFFPFRCPESWSSRRVPPGPRWTWGTPGSRTQTRARPSTSRWGIQPNFKLEVLSWSLDVSILYCRSCRGRRCGSRPSRPRTRTWRRSGWSPTRPGAGSQSRRGYRVSWRTYCARFRKRQWHKRASGMNYFFSFFHWKKKNGRKGLWREIASRNWVREKKRSINVVWKGLSSMFSAHSLLYGTFCIKTRICESESGSFFSLSLSEGRFLGWCLLLHITRIRRLDIRVSHCC